MRIRIAPVSIAALVAIGALGAAAQQAPGQKTSPAKLAALLAEANARNPRIEAARRAWQAAEQVPSQVSTLPDPEVMVQHFTVGSPRPFAGYSNSNFAYIGFGVSQDFPYPGKLRLRGEAAEREAAALRQASAEVERSAIADLKQAYFQLAYIQQTLGVLERDEKLLEQIEKIAEARYRVGQGNQQDVLKAQLNQTKILRELEHHHRVMGSLEASLKQLLNRPPDSADIITEPLTKSPLPYTSEQLLALARTGNPAVAAEQEMVRRQDLRVALAHKDFYPDFNVSYMWQHNAEQFRDYYMLTFGVRLPIYRRRRLQPELAQATQELEEARQRYQAEQQRAYFEVQDQYVKAETGAALLKIYHDGLIPQASATFDAGLAAYEAGREDFQTLLDSFLDVLNLDLEYWQTLADHESALARIEQVTGVRLN